MLCPPRCPLVSNPILRSFLSHSHANNFANPANPVLTPWFILLFKYGGRESWGGRGGGGVGEGLSLTRTSSPPDPPKSIHLNPFHYTATKSSFTPLEITTGQDKIYGHTAQRLSHEMDLSLMTCMFSLENQILQIITQNINHKLSIDYKFELLLYNLDLLMAPIPVRLAFAGFSQIVLVHFHNFV